MESNVTKLLAINSSAGSAESVSRILVDETIQQLRRQYSEATVMHRDLGAAPIPHLTTDTLAGVRGTPATGAELGARALSDELIAELRSADIVVIGAPMYNFSVATSLRAWFDHVLRAGETFRYTEDGPEGLLGDKRVIVIETRGGLYSEGRAKALDFQEPYLRQLLGFVGISEPTFIRAEKIGFGPDVREGAIADAKAQIAAATARTLGQAA
jgi:FMN-dependent NADH-azoreductase